MKIINGIFILVVITLCQSPVVVRASARRVPLPAALVLNQANDFLEENDISGAIKVLEAFKANRRGELSDLDKPDPQGYRHYLIGFMLGNCYLMTDQIQKAIKEYEWTVKVNPDYLQAWSNLGKAYYDSEQFAHSARAFTTAYDLSENQSPEYLYYAAIAHIASDNQTEALNCLNRLFTNHPRSIKLPWEKAFVQVLFSLERYQESIPHIQRVIEMEEESRKREWREILLSQYINLEMKKEAIDYAEHLVSIDPTYPDWWKSLAYLKLERDQYAQTLTALIIYGKLKPLSAKEIKLTASLALSLNIPIESSKLYESVAQPPYEKEVITGLAQSYARLYQPEKVIEWISLGLDQFEDESLRLLKANLLYSSDRYGEAINEYQTITKNNPNHGEAWLMMGYAYLNSNDISQATSALNRASQFPGQQSAASAILNQLNTASQSNP